MTNFSPANNKELNQAIRIEISRFIHFSNECYGGMVSAWLVVDPIRSCVYVSEDKREVFGFVDIYFINDFIQIDNNGFKPNQEIIDREFRLIQNDSGVEDLDI